MDRRPAGVLHRYHFAESQIVLASPALVTSARRASYSSFFLSACSPHESAKEEPDPQIVPRYRPALSAFADLKGLELQAYPEHLSVHNRDKENVWEYPGCMDRGLSRGALLANSAWAVILPVTSSSKL